MLAVGGACECAVRSSARASAREVCELARAEQRRVLIPHGVKRHPLGIGGVDGRSLRRVVVWRAASPITPRATAMLLRLVRSQGPIHYFDLRLRFELRA